MYPPDEKFIKLADQIPEEVILQVAHHLSLGLDCNVSIMDFRSAVADLFSELSAIDWVIISRSQLVTKQIDNDIGSDT